MPNDPNVQALTPGTPQEPQANEPTTEVVQDATQVPGNAEQPQVQEADENIKALQRELNRRQVENYQLQQQIEQMMQTQQQMMSRFQPQADENPYDYSTQFPQWQRWETQRAAQEANKQLLMTLQSLAVQNSEQQWQAAHPDVNLGEVKAFAKMRWGAQNFTQQVLDDAYSLMTQSENINKVRNTTFNQTLNQFRNPNQAAVPMRGGQQTPVQPQLRLADLLKEYNRSPEEFERKYPDNVKTEFWKAVEFERRQAEGG